VTDAAITCAAVLIAILALRGVRADGASAADIARRPQITETS
jgi:hypothetical protein